MVLEAVAVVALLAVLAANVEHRRELRHGRQRFEQAAVTLEREQAVGIDPRVGSGGAERHRIEGAQARGIQIVHAGSALLPFPTPPPNPTPPAPPPST